MKKRNLSSFESVFLGEFVTVFTTINTSSMTQQDETIRESNSPLAFEGFLIDTDESYYYLGQTPKEASMAIKVDTVLSVIISEPKNKYDELLDDIGDEPDESELN